MTNFSFLANLIVKKEQSTHNELFYPLLMTNWTKIPCYMVFLCNRTLFSVPSEKTGHINAVLNGPGVPEAKPTPLSHRILS